MSNFDKCFLDHKPVYFAECAVCHHTSASHESENVAAAIAEAAGYTMDPEVGYVACGDCREAK